MSFCTNCGTKFQENWKFCGSCGTKNLEEKSQGHSPRLEKSTELEDRWLSEKESKNISQSESNLDWTLKELMGEDKYINFQPKTNLTLEFLQASSNLNIDWIIKQALIGPVDYEVQVVFAGNLVIVGKFNSLLKSEHKKPGMPIIIYSKNCEDKTIFQIKKAKLDSHYFLKSSKSVNAILIRMIMMDGTDIVFYTPIETHEEKKEFKQFLLFLKTRFELHFYDEVENVVTGAEWENNRKTWQKRLNVPVDSFSNMLDNSLDF